MRQSRLRTTSSVSDSGIVNTTRFVVTSGSSKRLSAGVRITTYFSGFPARSICLGLMQWVGGLTVSRVPRLRFALLVTSPNTRPKLRILSGLRAVAFTALAGLSLAVLATACFFGGFRAGFANAYPKGIAFAESAMSVGCMRIPEKSFDLRGSLLRFEDFCGYVPGVTGRLAYGRD